MSIHKLVTVTSIRFARNSRRHYRQHGRRDTRNYSFRFVELTLSSFFPFSTLPFQERIHPLVWHRMLIRSYISIIPPSFFYSYFFIMKFAFENSEPTSRSIRDEFKTDFTSFRRGNVTPPPPKAVVGFFRSCRLVILYVLRNWFPHDVLRVARKTN